jgi:hypothetical protein
MEVFDYATQAQESDNVPDAQVTAWKEADGTVDLMIPDTEAWRMRGPDLEHLTIDTKEIYSSTQSGSQTTENQYNYHHWMMGPYSLDGTTFYSLTHTEWYACLLAGNCNTPITASGDARGNGWANSVNSMVSTNAGATWQLNTVNGNHTVAAVAQTWTGSVGLADQIYLHAPNHSGMFQPSRVIQQGGYYYSVCYYLHRNFSAINPAAGQDEAPVDKFGLTIIRTTDVTNPNGWQVWTGGSNYGPMNSSDIAVFLPQANGQDLNTSAGQIVYDTNAQTFILVITTYQPGSPVYYMTSASLANPSWSPAKAIAGTATLASDPAGPAVGFYAMNYPSIIDDASAGYNYEFTSSGKPQLFYCTFPPVYGGQNQARNIYRLPLTITYK